MKNGLQGSELVAPRVKRSRKPKLRKAVKMKSIPLTFMGETMTVEEWAVDLDISVHLIVSRMRAGRSVEDCLIRGRVRSPARPRAAHVSAATVKRRPVMRVPTLAEVDAMRRAA